MTPTEIGSLLLAVAALAASGVNAMKAKADRATQTETRKDTAQATLSDDQRELINTLLLQNKQLEEQIERLRERFGLADQRNVELIKQNIQQEGRITRQEARITALEQADQRLKDENGMLRATLAHHGIEIQDWKRREDPAEPPKEKEASE